MGSHKMLTQLFLPYFPLFLFSSNHLSDAKLFRNTWQGPLSVVQPGQYSFPDGLDYDFLLQSGLDSVGLPEEEWFDQYLDHNNVKEDRTWKQRFWKCLHHYKDGGPVFLMIGGEGEESPGWLSAGAMAELAAQYSGAKFILEHRFYGASRPTNDTSVKNLAYLSSRQALADLAKFIESMKIQYNLTGPWIAIGGSYPGSLAGWLRLKYPHLIAGSIASSGPVWAKPDFPEYLEVVEGALTTSANGCNTDLKTAVSRLTKLTLHRVGWRMINKMFKLCEPFQGNDPREVATLIETLLGNIETVVQYNNDHKEGSKYANITTDTICRVLMDRSAGSELTQFAAVNDLTLGIENKKCLDASYRYKVSLMKKTNYEDPETRVPGDVGNRQWFYQTCTEFGWYQSSDQSGYPFGKLFPVDFFISMCSDVFGARFKKKLLQRGIRSTLIEYGGRNLTVSNVVFVQGSLDPWHTLGVQKDVSETSPLILIEGTSHCSNLYPKSPNDPPQLVEARNKTAEIVGKWIKEYKNNNI